MKRLIRLMTIAMIMFSVCMLYNSNTVEAAKAKKMNISVKSGMNSIRIKWNKKNVSYYKIYRAKVYKEDDYTASDDCYYRGKIK